MQRIFQPAIALLNSMGYTKKFSLLWLMSLVAIAVVVYSLFDRLDQVIQPSRRQLQGLELIEPISRSVQHLQLHRGISAALLGGNETMQGRRAAREKEVDAAFKVMEQVLPPALAANRDFRHIQASWKRLRKEGLHWTAAENFAAHTRLIEQIQLFEGLVNDEYRLTLDNEIATAYLMGAALEKLPHTLEYLGRLRAYGTGILYRKQVTESQRIELKVMMGELASALKSLNVHIDKTASYNLAVQQSLLEVRDEIADSARQITSLVAADMLSGQFSTPPDVFLDMATVAIDRGYRQMYQVLLPTARNLIQARIVRAQNTLLVTTGSALLLFLLVVYVSIGIYYAIVGSIRSLVRSARTFARGDLSVRVNLGTRDELGQIGESFNIMADGFSALLEERRRAEEALKKESYKNEMLLRTASDGIHILDLEGNVVQVNEAFCRMLGYTAAQMQGMNVAQWDAQLTAAQIKEKIDALGSNASIFETRHRRRDGSLIDAEISIARVNIDGLRLVYCSARDVTERKQAEQALRESREKFHAVIETALDGVVQMDAEGIITDWNSRAENIFGWTKADAVGRALDETIIPPQYRDAHRQGLKRFLLSGNGPILNSRVELTALHRDGHEFPVELSVVPIRTSGHAVEKFEFSAFIRDITRRKESESLIWKQANFDTLTGLPNRHMFRDRLEQEIRKAQRAGQKIPLLFIDLDKFKEVNDTLGHSMGDILLIEAARRLSECVRKSDTVARLGGDEFIIILAELDSTRDIERIAGNILQKLAEPFHLVDEVAYVSASIGITLYPDDATAAEELLKNADQAMYAAKDKGRNRYSYFTHAMQQAAQARLRLLNELRGALAANQFRAYYQPIVDMATGRINKAEALIRWQHPERGMIDPAQFIPLAEETGLIVEIGDWMFKESARQLQQLRTSGNTGFQISVNVSPVQFRSADNLYETWLAYLQELGLPGQSMVIEITEGLLLDADAAVTDKLRAFHEIGIQVAIDDFGTGYSSLSYLKKFDIDFLKIDQSFVHNLVTDPDDMALSEAIIVMAHKLGLQVIAEGVETPEQCKLLADAGCNFAQGYLFSRPVPAEEFAALLKSGLIDGPQTH